jgi:hypothetical protein
MENKDKIVKLGRMAKWDKGSMFFLMGTHGNWSLTNAGYCNKRTSNEVDRKRRNYLETKDAVEKELYDKAVIKMNKELEMSRELDPVGSGVKG